MRHFYVSQFSRGQYNHALLSSMREELRDKVDLRVESPPSLDFERLRESPLCRKGIYCERCSYKGVCKR